MKFLNSPQKGLIIFLVSIIILSFFFIIRLEIKAASMQDQWEKHQASLKKNEDVLNGLVTFRRFAGMNQIKFNEQEFAVICGDIQSAHSWVTIDPKYISLSTKGNIKIEASGDIDIVSEKGNVNIKGKILNMNE